MAHHLLVSRTASFCLACGLSRIEIKTYPTVTCALARTDFHHPVPFMVLNRDAVAQIRKDHLDHLARLSAE